MPTHRGLELLQLRERVAEVARLRRATGRVGLRIEVHDDVLALELRQPHGLAVLVLQRERGGLVADGELCVMPRSMPPRAAPRACSRSTRPRPRMYAPRPSRDSARSNRTTASLRIPIEGAPSDDARHRHDGRGRRRRHGRRPRAATGVIDIPFFGWFFQPLTRIAGNRAAAYAIAVLRHDLEGGPQPKAPSGVHRAPERAVLTTSRRRCSRRRRPRSRSSSFASALFGQLADPIGDSFGVSDATLSVALAITRVGAIVALFATALADRRGRRRAILLGVVGSAIACAVSAVAPTLEIFTAAQMLQRAFVNTTLIVAGIAVIEEAPEGARAYSASMLALAGGFGFSFAVVALPFADIGDYGWRIPYVAGALTILLAPRIARNLAETTRYTQIAVRPEISRGRAARAPRPEVRAPLRAARGHRVPRQRLQRAVVAADEQVPRGRPRLLELRHRAVPDGHDRAPRPHRARDGRPARRATRPQAGRDRRAVDRDVDADGVLPLRRHRCSGSCRRSRC